MASSSIKPYVHTVKTANTQNDKLGSSSIVITQLPLEILNLIGGFLSPIDLCRLRCCNKEFLQIFSTPEYKKLLDNPLTREILFLRRNARINFFDSRKDKRKEAYRIAIKLDTLAKMPSYNTRICLLHIHDVMIQWFRIIPLENYETLFRYSVFNSSPLILNKMLNAKRLFKLPRSLVLSVWRDTCKMGSIREVVCFLNFHKKKEILGKSSFHTGLTTSVASGNEVVAKQLLDCTMFGKLPKKTLLKVANEAITRNKHAILTLVLNYSGFYKVSANERLVLLERACIFGQGESLKTLVEHQRYFNVITADQLALSLISTISFSSQKNKERLFEGLIALVNSPCFKRISIKHFGELWKIATQKKREDLLTVFATCNQINYIPKEDFAFSILWATSRKDDKILGFLKSLPSFSRVDEEAIAKAKEESHDLTLINTLYSY